MRFGVKYSWLICELLWTDLIYGDAGLNILQMAFILIRADYFLHSMSTRSEDEGVFAMPKDSNF